MGHEQISYLWRTQAAAKRFHVTGTGKVMVRRAGKRHKNQKLTVSHRGRLGCVAQPSWVGQHAACGVPNVCMVAWAARPRNRDGVLWGCVA